MVYFKIYIYFFVIDLLRLLYIVNELNFSGLTKMPPYEALYGRKCRSPLHWDEVGERMLLGPKLVNQAIEKIRVERSQISIR